MKHWTSQLFPIILLGLLAALSFWLAHVVEMPEPKRDGKFRHDPDAVIENFFVRRFTAEGVLQYRLDSPYMQHFPDDDSSLLRFPKLVNFRPDAPTMTLSGNNAFTTSGGSTVFFWDNVIATRAAQERRPRMDVYMPDLTVQPDDGFAFTDSPVDIHQGPSWIKGTGMHLDNNTSILVLKSQVTGLYYSPRNPPP